MKKAVNFIKRHSLFILSCCALFVGTNAASSVTVLMTHQPSCPEELLK